MTPSTTSVITSLKKILDLSYIVTDINNSGNDLNKIKQLISDLDIEQQKLVISSSNLRIAEKTKLELLIGSGDIIKANTLATHAQTLSEEEWLAQQRLSIGVEEADAVALNVDTVATEVNTAAKKTEFSVINMLKVAWSKLIAVIAANPVIAVVAGIAAIFLAIKKYVDHLEKARQATIEAAKEAKSAIDSVKSDFESLSSSTDKVKEKFAELAQGVENLGKINQSRGKLSTEDYEEFLSLSNQLAKLFPQLIVGYDDNGNAILDLSGDVDTIVGSLNNLVDVQRKLANQEIIDKMPAVWAGYTLDLEEYNKELENSQNHIDELLKLLNEIPDSQTVDISFDNIFDFDKAINKAGIDLDGAINDFRLNYIGHGNYAVSGSYSYDLQQLTEGEKNALLNALGELSSEYEDALQLVKGNIAAANADMSNYINTWLSGEWNYNKMDFGLQNVVKDVLLNTDWLNSLPSNISNDWDKVSNWLQRNFLYAINDIDNEQIKTALSDTFNGVFTTESLHEIIDQLTSNEYGFTENNPLILYLQTKLIERSETVDNVKNKLQDEFADKVEELSIGDLQIAANLDISEDTLLSWDELIDKIEEAKFYNKTPLLLSAWQSSLYSPDQTYSDLIKDWESQTKQLQSVLSDIRSGDAAMTAADIVSQFPNLQPYIEQYEDLALAVDTFMRNSYQELLDKFGDTGNIEGFSYELEYLQGVLNEGLGGANNIDHLVSTYEELIGILDQVNSDHTFTEEEIANLINKYDALKDAVIITTDGYKLEDDALIDLINNYISLSNTAISNQIELTQTTIDGIEARVKAWGMEIEALKTVAKIYNATGGSKDAVGQYIYDNYGTNLTSATPAIIAAATEYAAASDQLDGLLEQLNNSYAAGSKYKSNGNSSSESKSFTDTLEKELAALDKSMEAGYINFNDYITARLGLIEEYYRKGRIAADEYYSYLEKHYDQQLSAMDRVVNAVTRRIDTEIDGLEKQKSSIESIYNAQIESLEKQKTLLQEANKERERQADLQKSLYELERAKQQKTKMVFTEDGGMRYVTDDAAIKEASRNVDDARLEIQIAELDKSISKLEEARDRETTAFDDRISKLKEYKDSWSDLTSAYEEEQDNLLAAQILGQEWEEDILNGRLDTLDAFKNQYISIQQAMADAAWQSANEQIKAAQEAQKGALGTTSGDTPIADTVTSSGPHTSLGNKSNIKFVPFHEYASGTDNAKKGINLVGEDGTEAYFDNHGHIALITEPTLIPMEGGEVVKSESVTRKLLNPNNLAAVDTSTLAGVDSQDPIASGRLRPIQSGDRAWELQQSLIAYLAKIGSDINALLAPVNAIQRDTEQLAGTSINTNHIHNANQMQQVTIGDIHVTCPGVTSQEIMNQVGEALNRQLGGIALDALQESTKR